MRCGTLFVIIFVIQLQNEMKRVVILIGFYLSFFVIAAQQVEPLVFREKSFNFGEITEQGGNADHEFVFTNASGRPVSILSVQASCGCTTPDWTKQPVAPGKTGFIKASFDPKGRPGYFNKTLSVTTNLGGNAILLEIKGEVVLAKQEVSAASYPVKKGSLKLKAGSFNVGKVFINKETPVREFDVYNDGTTPIHFSKSVGPTHIKVQAPEVLKPNEHGVVRIIYDGRIKNQYGFVTDNVELLTDDESLPVKSFPVYATIEEFFPARSGATLAKAPILSMEVTTINIERVKLGSSTERQVKLKNAGKEDLNIRALQGNCSCVNSTVDSQKLKPGDETTLHITFMGQGRGGTQQKALTVYSTDPQNPIQRIAITAFVEE